MVAVATNRLRRGSWGKAPVLKRSSSGLVSWGRRGGVSFSRPGVGRRGTVGSVLFRSRSSGWRLRSRRWRRMLGWWMRGSDGWVGGATWAPFLSTSFLFTFFVVFFFLEHTYYFLSLPAK